MVICDGKLITLVYLMSELRKASNGAKKRFNRYFYRCAVNQIKKYWNQKDSSILQSWESGNQEANTVFYSSVF